MGGRELSWEGWVVWVRGELKNNVACNEAVDDHGACNEAVDVHV